MNQCGGCPQQATIGGDGQELVALYVAVAPLPVWAGELEGGAVPEVGGHLVVGHVLRRPRDVRPLDGAQRVDLVQVPGKEGAQAGLAQLGVEHRRPLIDVGVPSPVARGEVRLVQFLMDVVVLGQEGAWWLEW